jgi:exodeoxyribonuclease V alpha subunit
MTTLQGVLVDITFRNEDSGFTVARFKIDRTDRLTAIVGVLTAVDCGQTLKLTGEWQEHKRFGRQFVIESYEIVRPTTIEGIELLLGSGLITNIGGVRAKKIIETFGLQTLDILDNEPRRLLEVEGIGKKIFEKINSAWQREKSMRGLMLFLQQCSVSVNLAHKIFKAYGGAAQENISRNPYCLVDDIWGVGFSKADAIAQKLGFAHDSFKRIRAGLTHVMQEAAADGHTYLPKASLSQTAAGLLEVKEELVLFSLDHCVAQGRLVVEEDRIFLPQFAEAETTVARLLAEKAGASAGASNALIARCPPEKIDAWLASYCSRSAWIADPKQIEAVKAVLSHGVVVLTGGPGTGKTTTLQVIVSFFREHNVGVTLAAPTGRAAQRMGNVSGLKASTLHRLLEFRPGKGGFQFARNADNPLPLGVLIVDEVSMIDILLMRSLLCALRPDAALVLVGDSNQLPSVGPGNVLADIIASGAIAHIELTTIFRQAAQSRIVTSAHEIIHGIRPTYANAKDENCFFIAEDDPERCLATVVDLVSKRLPLRYGFNPISDIQVLSPMHRGTLGTQNINRVLQAIVNPRELKLTRGEITFAQGDRVMQLRNNYDLGVFNGDIGYVADIVDEAELVVDFDGQKITYEQKDLDELVHAYCISIHKSQGCEFKAVIVLMSTQHYILLQRNLLYTAITRAREMCVLIGTAKAVSIAVANNEARNRYSRLAQRIRLMSKEPSP